MLTARGDAKMDSTRKLGLDWQCRRASIGSALEEPCSHGKESGNHPLATQSTSMPADLRRRLESMAA